MRTTLVRQQIIYSIHASQKERFQKEMVEIDMRLTTMPLMQRRLIDSIIPTD